MTKQLLTLKCHYIVVTLYCVVNAISLAHGGVRNAREQKAQEIAARAKITRGNGYYLVPSQSSAARHRVAVDGPSPSCSCQDFELRGKDCKHILAVRLWLEQEKDGISGPSPVTSPAPKVKRPTYPQDWPNYNLAQVREKGHFLELLASLCSGIPQPPLKNPQKGGRPPVLLSDAVFAVAFKVYSTVSTRRFMTDLRAAHERGFITQPLCFSKVIKALEDEALTPILHDLIRESSLPLASVETEFAVDSSGFCTSRFTRWFDVKYGVTRETADWVKVHSAVGVKTTVVTAALILDKHAADVSQFPALIKATAQGFTVREASADKAYTCTENFQAVADLGGTLYAPFKKRTTGAIGGIYEKMFHYFSFHREEFLKRYHKRSNSESTFSMVKAKVLDHVRSKTDVARKNEVLCKILCHNICCLVSAIYELGIVPVFWPDQQEEEGPAILPMVQSR